MVWVTATMAEDDHHGPCNCWVAAEEPFHNGECVCWADPYWLDEEEEKAEVDTSLFPVL